MRLNRKRQREAREREVDTDKGQIDLNNSWTKQQVAQLFFAVFPPSEHALIRAWVYLHATSRRRRAFPDSYCWCKEKTLADATDSIKLTFVAGVEGGGTRDEKRSDETENFRGISAALQVKLENSFEQTSSTSAHSPPSTKVQTEHGKFTLGIFSAYRAKLWGNLFAFLLLREELFPPC
jgi:hypothetical protein